MALCSGQLATPVGSFRSRPESLKCTQRCSLQVVLGAHKSAAAQRSRRRFAAVTVHASGAEVDVEVESAISPPPTAKPTGLQRTPELEEKYAVLDSGKWGCNSCGYVYDQAIGDPNYPISAGMEFKKLPEDWICPTCGAPQSNFASKGRQVGFVQNQQYGLGTNTMTASQKGLLIWGFLGFGFFLFLGGYFLN